MIKLYFFSFRFSARLLRIKLKLGTYYILTNYLGYSLFQSLFVFKIPMPPDSGRKKDGVWCEVKAAENDQKKVVCMHCDGMIWKNYKASEIIALHWSAYRPLFTDHFLQLLLHSIHHPFSASVKRYYNSKTLKWLNF